MLDKVNTVREGMIRAGIPAKVRYGGCDQDHIRIEVTVALWHVERAKAAAQKNFGLEAVWVRVVAE